MESGPPVVLTFRAYAKINLGLLVLRKRADGYHDIETIFHRVNLWDDISLRPSRDLAVESSSTEIPGDERNICFKAARLVREHLGIGKGATLSIGKRIPVGAGLGGGSADAAGVLLHLPGFWGEHIDEGHLVQMALELGSDVPYFMKEGSARARGRGEHLTYFTLDIPYVILLCTPAISISTAWAYQHVRPRDRSMDLRDIAEGGMRDPGHLRELVNDFEEPVFTAHPAIREVKQAMLDMGAVFSSLSGSGSTVYGMFGEVAAAREASSTLTSRGYRTSITEPHFRGEG